MKQKRFPSVFLPVLTLGLLVACGAAPAETPGSDEVEPTVAPEPAREQPVIIDPVRVRWYTGMCCSPRHPYEAIVDEFNASQDEIELVLDNEYPDMVAAVSSGDAPDLFGPLGIRGRDSARGAWMDLQSLIDAGGYDLSDFDPAIVEFFRDKEEGQLGIPLGVYPSFIFVNKDLFDQAGLPYPPQEYGAPYVDEKGEEHPWDLDTLRELAMKLTVDAAGNNAASPSFDADNIVQFGYLEQLTDMRGALMLFGSGSLVADDGKTAQMPEHWREGAKWVYDAMWTDHFWPTEAYVNSDLLGNSNAFSSGNLAMAHVHTWFAAAWALDSDAIDFAWDTAAVPAYGDKVTAKIHADAFCIPKGARYPEAAFEVLTYMMSPEVAPKLLAFNDGTLPARLSLQKDYLKSRVETVFPGQDINWQVALDSIEYADNPNHESWLPNFQESIWAYTETWTHLGQEPGLDVDAELDTLLEKLQAIFDAAKK